MEHGDSLVLVRQRSGTGQRGRRRIETSVKRGIVVIAIASWQAVVQDMTRFLLDRSMPQPTEPNYGVARLIRGQVLAALNNFSTPNAENARQLLQSVGFDPRPYWTWTNGALGRREVTYRPADIEQGCGIGSGCDMPYHTATKSCRRPTCSARGRCGLFRDHGPISDCMEAPLRCPFPDGCRAVSRA